MGPEAEPPTVGGGGGGGEAGERRRHGARAGTPKGATRRRATRDPEEFCTDEGDYPEAKKEDRRKAPETRKRRIHGRTIDAVGARHGQPSVPLVDMSIVDADSAATTAMLRAISELVEQTRNLRVDRAKPPSDIVFSGETHEDPNDFIAKIEEWCEEMQVLDTRRVVIAKSCLKGEARRWADRTVGDQVHWELFRDRILNRFDSPEHLSNLTQKLYGEKQGERQDTFQFVGEKNALFDRLALQAHRRATESR